MKHKTTESHSYSFRNTLLLLAFALLVAPPFARADDTASKPRETMDLPALPPGQDTTIPQPALPALPAAPQPPAQLVPLTPASPAAPSPMPATTNPGAAPVTPVTATPSADANASGAPLQLLPQPAPGAEKPQMQSAPAPAPAPLPMPATDANKPPIPMPVPAQPLPGQTVAPTQPANMSPLPVTPSGLDKSPVSVMPIPVVPMPPSTPQPSAAPQSSATPDAGKPPVPPPAVTPPAAETPSASSQYPNLTIMFSSEEMAVIARMIRAYDSYDEHKPAEAPKDNITGLFPENAPNEPAEVQLELPNLFLGSIVYDSPKNWVVTINGKRINAQHNAPGGEFYVTKISRREIELIWKPHSLNDVPDKWNEATEGGKNPIPGILVDAANGVIKLDMHPNQTFVPSKLAIREGLIKPDASFFEKIREAAEALTKTKQDQPK